MSLFATLTTAGSGLGVSSLTIGVLGDNISNLSTVGFKQNRASFADYLPQDVAGISGPSTYGTGAGTYDINIMFAQGALESSTNSLDMAISGDGFFLVNDGTADFYTRNGMFYLADDGLIVNANGDTLQGYNADQGNLTTIVSDLRVDTSSLPQAATTEVIMKATLDSETDFDTTPLSDGDYTMDGNTDTIEDIADDSDFATSVTVYDSLGQSHEVTICFEKTSETEWSWFALVDGGELGGTDEMAFVVSQGTMEFDSDGYLSDFTQTNTSSTTPWNFTGSASGDIEFDFGFDGTEFTDGDVRQVAAESALTSVSQDGYSTGTLAGVSVAADGIISGQYSNGEELILGQVVLAKFESNAGLERAGETLYWARPEAGDPAIGAPGTGGRGDITGFALEASNVDLENQFVQLIRAQRSYQAASRVVGTADEALTELVNLV